MTPASKQNHIIPRVNVSHDDIKAVSKIHIAHYFGSEENQPLKFKLLPEIKVDDEDFMIDMLWKISFPIIPKRPGWSGYMQMIHKGDHPGVASTVFLPMIDLNSSDLSCIFSTLQFVCARELCMGIS